jgi:hypothetical protein
MNSESGEIEGGWKVWLLVGLNFCEIALELLLYCSFGMVLVIFRSFLASFDKAQSLSDDERKPLRRKKLIFNAMIFISVLMMSVSIAYTLLLSLFYSRAVFTTSK